MKKYILGVRVDDISMEEILTSVVSLRAKRGNLFKKIASSSAPRNDTATLIFTPNPEFIVEAQNNPEFKMILNSSALNVPDGVGLQIFGGIKNRVPGYELMLRLCEEAAKNGWTVGLFGGAQDVAKKAKAVLEKKYPGIKIKFAIDGNEADNVMLSQRTLGSIKMDPGSRAGMTPVSLLFVALGMVKQERFLSSLCHPGGRSPIGSKKDAIALLQHDVFRVGMGVGGSFNEIVGLEKSAPMFIKRLGLKWLWRLINDLKRIKRIFNAVIIFPIMVFSEKLWGKKKS